MRDMLLSITCPAMAHGHVSLLNPVWLGAWLEHCKHAIQVSEGKTKCASLICRRTTTATWSAWGC